MKIKRLPKKILAVLLTCAVAIGMFISTPATAAKAAGKPTLTYFVHAQSYGWMQPVAEGKTAGTTGVPCGVCDYRGDFPGGCQC